MVFRSRSVFVALAALVITAGLAEARQAPVLTSSVNFAQLSLSWTATGGATSYRLDAGTASGTYNLGSLPLGLVTSFSANSPAVGTFFVRVVAQTPSGDVPSNEAQLVVTSLVAPPTNVQVYSYCNAVGITWSPAAGTSPSSYVVRASRFQGTTEVNIPTTSTQLFANSPGGTIYFKVAAVSGGAVSPDSAEVSVVTTGGIGNAPPAVLSNRNFGSAANLTWSAPGATAIALNAFLNGAPVGSATLPAANARVQQYLPPATWQVDATPVFPCGNGATTSSTFTTPDPNTAKMTPRTADPAPNSVLPTPSYASSVVLDFANRYRGELLQSCRDTGGNNNWLFRVVAELRKFDKRWGLNWKRANVGDMSQDIVTYNWSSDPDEGTRNTRVYDIISGHCGPNPGYNFTEVTVLGSTGSVWTLLPYLNAGYQP